MRDVSMARAEQASRIKNGQTEHDGDRALAISCEPSHKTEHVICS